MYPPANTVNHQAKIRFSKIARTVYILAFHFLSTVHVRVYHDYPTRCLPTSSPRMHLQKHSLRSGLFWNTFQSSFWKKESHFNLPGSTVWVNQLWYSRVWFWALNKVTRLSSMIRTHPGPYKQAKVFSISVLISPRYSIFKFENWKFWPRGVHDTEYFNLFIRVWNRFITKFLTFFNASFFLLKGDGLSLHWEALYFISGPILS